MPRNSNNSSLASSSASSTSPKSDDKEDLLLLDDSDSSRGIQSSFVRSQIRKQRRRGDWSERIAPPSSPPPSPASARTDAAVHEGTTTTMMMPAPSGTMMPISPSDARGAAAVYTGMTDKDDAMMTTTTTAATRAPRDEEEDDDDEVQQQQQQRTVVGQQQQQQQQQQQRHQPPLGTVTLSPNNNNNSPNNSNNRHAAPTARRVLSSASLVGMLKIQPICEVNEMHDDIEKYNLRGTVQMDHRAQETNEEEEEEEEDDVSDVTTDEGEDDDANAHAEDDVLGISVDVMGGGGGGGREKNAGTFLPLHLQPIMDSTSGNIINGNDNNNGSSNNNSSSSSSININSINNNNNHDTNRTDMGDSKHSAYSSSTFYLQSISSEENITHVSSAPDYDYFSMTSDEEGENNDDAITVKASPPEIDPLGAASSGATRRVAPPLVAAIPPPRRSPPKTTTTTATTTKTTTTTITSAGDNPTNANAEELSREVRELMGIPTSRPRIGGNGNGIGGVVRGGIASRNTVLRLRKMANRKEEGSDAGGEPSAVVADVSVSANANASVSANANANATERVAYGADDSTDSAESSVDLAFGDGEPPSSRSSSREDDLGGTGGTRTRDRKKKKKLDKWERIRLQRKNSRASIKTKGRRRGERNAEDDGDGSSHEGEAKGRTRRSADVNRTTMMTTARVVDGRDGGGTRTENGTTGAGRRRTSSSGPRANSARDDDRPPARIETAATPTAASSSSSGIESKSGIASKLGRMYKRLSSGSWQIALAADDVSTSTSSSSSNDDDDDAEQRSSAWERNVLSEGEYYLAMSMLVYVYALLRESSVLGHTDISFDEIDVNSYQSDPGRAVTTVGEKNGRGGGGGGKFLSKTKSAGFIVRVVMDELEKKGAFSSVEMNEGDMSVLREFKQWVSDSHTKKIDTATEKTIKELRRKVARRRWRRAIHAVRLMVRLGHCTSVPFNQRRGENPGFRRKGRGGTMGGLRCSTTDSIVNLSKALQKAPSMSGAMSILSTEQQSKLAKESDIKDIIDGALEQPRFFIEGSLLSNLIESGIEVVKFGDRHPNDVVYSICCNRQYKRVSVVFRGTVNSHNWLMNMKFAMTEHPNPIPEDYPGREDTLGLHTGFSLYLTRQRKDDSLTKIEEIFANIDSIGKELAPDGDYQLSITGHSLGGALANILSFYAATSSLFAHVKTIRVFTYAAPRVGCQRFAYAFQHLERIGKIRMARFTNTRDLVPLIPFHGMSRSYKHVGMHIRMHGVTQYAQYWLRQALDVSYPRNHGIWSQLWRGLRSSLIRNLNSVQGYKRAHTLSEYQRRIRFALEYRSILAQAGNLHNIIRSRLKTLDEYYFIKGASNVTCTGALTRVSLEDRAKENVRREARKIVVVVALIAMLEAIVIGSFHYKSIGVPEIQDLFCDNSMIFSLTENKAPPNGKDEKTGPVSGGMKSSWTSSWTKWFEKAPASSQPPCVWGHCSFPSRPYLPWGVPMQHTLSVATINSDSWHFQPVGSQQELSWEAQQLFCREDIHHRASEIILARSRGEISE